MIYRWTIKMMPFVITVLTHHYLRWQNKDHFFFLLPYSFVFHSTFFTFFDHSFSSTLNPDTASLYTLYFFFTSKNISSSSSFSALPLNRFSISHFCLLNSSSFLIFACKYAVWLPRLRSFLPFLPPSILLLAQVAFRLPRLSLTLVDFPSTCLLREIPLPP